MQRIIGILFLSLLFIGPLPAHEVVFIREGKPLFSITYPETWKQTVEKADSDLQVFHHEVDI